MKVSIVSCFVTVFAVTAAITVPPFWPKKSSPISLTNNQKTPPPPKIIHQDEFNFHPLPKPVGSNQRVFINHPVNKMVNDYRPQSYQIVHFDEVTVQPVFSTGLKTKNNPIVRTGPKITYKEPKPTAVPREFKRVKNEELQEESSEEKEEYREPISEHENPRDVPTKPVYPGEGQWAKFGLKHTPYIREQKSSKASQIENDEEQTPEGYDTFEKGQEQFKSAQNKFQHDLATFPERHQLKPSPVESSEEDSEPLYEKPEIGFVPQKLYAQVRRTETEKHLPRSSIDPEQEENASRLREVIKDSKIHTVYTEEGYEDSAYDHAGHEKNAENSEKHAQITEGQAGSAGRGKGGGNSKYSDEGGRRYGKNSERKRLRDDVKSKDENFDESQSYEKLNKRLNQDADSAETNYESKKISYLPVKDVKKVMLKNGEQEMEIHTEIKYAPGPQKKRHKYVKIIPSNKKTDLKVDEEKTSTEKQLRRVKRYDKDRLSKMYVRKKPNYYWKKRKTTTERPTFNMRQKFETAFRTYNSKQVKNDIEKPITEPVNTSTLISTTTTTTSTTTTTTPSTTTTTQPEDPEVPKEEVTAKISKPSSPKRLPVKIRKFIIKRQKRYTIDYPKIDVDLKEFVDVEKLPKPTQKPDLTHVKYPYYQLPVSENLNQNSPLRYAEDVENIPKKVESEMSFYESRSHIICPEVESDVDPIPDRVKNQEEGEESDKMADTPDLPRLKGLGDKIDCMKEKYFGENPLDSPFFQEEIIEAPAPFFSTKTSKAVEETKHNNNNYASPDQKENLNTGMASIESGENTQLSPEDNYSQRPKSRKRELKIKILEPIVVIDDELFESATVNPIHRSTEAVLKPPYTLTEMMKMNDDKMMKFQPKSIYDLLEQDEMKSTNTQNFSPGPEKFIIIYDSQDLNKINSVEGDNPLENREKIDQPKVKNYQAPVMSDLVKLQPATIPVVPPTIRPQIRKRPENTIKKLSMKSIRKPPVKKQSKPLPISIKTTTTQLPSTTKAPVAEEIIQTTTTPTTTSTSPPTTSTSPPTTSQLPVIAKTNHVPSHLKMIPPFKMYAWNRPNRRMSSWAYTVFDISQYLPRVPNHRILTSEVQYKDEIKPSEQMRVYSDVLRTIQESKEVGKNEETADSKPLVIKLNIPTSTEAATTTTQESSTTSTITSSDISAESSENIIGLAPPSYRSVYEFHEGYQRKSQPLSESQITEASNNINYYYVLGLRPPPSPYKHRLTKRSAAKKSSKSEDDDLMMEESEVVENYVDRHGRSKRSPGVRGEEFARRKYIEEDMIMEESERSYSATPSRKPKVYTEIVRARPQRPVEEEPEDEEEEEDLNPKKRVYEINKPTSTKAPPEYEDVILEEEISEPEKPKTTSKPIIYPVEANSENPNVAQYIFFVEKLHEKWEKEAPSTTTTEAAPETTTQLPKTVVTQTVAESVNVRRGEPAYLQIITQLHEIRKEEEKKNPTTTTTTEAPVEEEVQQGPVKNSNPFLESVIPENFMSELNSMQADLDPSKSTNSDSSRTRNYSTKFKTNIDTSKYKTIERSPVSVRHNMSSRYSAEDQELPLTKVQTTQTPMIIAIIRKPQATEEPSVDPITDSILEESTNEPEPEVVITTTARSRQRTRTRARPVTTTTSQPITTVTSNPIFRRRRPTRITTTTTQSPVTQFQHRRRRLKNTEAQSLVAEVPSNHRTVYAPVTHNPETVPVTEEPKKQRRFQKVQERRVMSEVTLTRFYEPSSGEEDDSSSASSDEAKKHQYEVIGPLSNVETGHGGNYKHEHDQTTSEKTEDETTTSDGEFLDTVSPSEDFYSDPTLAFTVNQLKDEITTTTEKSQASNTLLSNEELSEKESKTPSYSKVSLYPNMARMVNRLAETSTEPDIHEEAETRNEKTEYKPTFIKDPSRRMYYYAKL